MSPVEAAWVAGIIEGEGCIHWASTKTKYATIKVTMTDRDVIDRLAEWTGVGRVSINKKREDRKQAWSWAIFRQEDFLDVAEAIEPYLLSRRSAKLAQVRDQLAEHRRGVTERRSAKFIEGYGICTRGHDKAIVGVLLSHRDKCAQCHRENSLAAYHRSRGTDVV